MNQTVTLEVFYPHCQERVWQALTDRRTLAAWMMDNDFEPRLGHKFHFREDMLGLDRCIHCEVIELEPPNRLAYRWQESQTEDSTIVIWTLTSVSGGTTLQLRHHQPMQATAISPSVLFQRSSQSSRQTQARAMFDSIARAKVYESPIGVIEDLWNDASRTLHPSGSTFLVAEPNLEQQAQWHHRLIRLEQKLGSDSVSN